jgi:hypothetical protein
MIPKFRAWDKHEQKMFASDELIIWNNNVYANDSKKLSCNHLIGWTIDEEYLMQATGLFDKKGAEIFEGDILKSNKYITSVFYERGAYCVKFCRTTNTTVTMNVISFIEKYKTKVIGNIYENPELLEVE